MEISLESMAIDMPRVAGHPNRLPFRGVLTLVDVASDKPPAGARGHRVLLTRAAAEKALPSLLGMALDFTPNLDGHDARRKVGVITSADMVPDDDTGAPPSGGAQRRLRVGLFPSGANSSRPGERPHPSPTEGRGWGTSAWQLEIEGYIFARDFPDVVERVRSGNGLVVRDCQRTSGRRIGGGVDPHRGDVHRRSHAAAEQGSVWGYVD